MVFWKFAYQNLCGGPLASLTPDKAKEVKHGSHREISEFWDKHDLAEVWDRTEVVEFSVNITSERKYFALDIDMSNRVSKIAEMHGISPETLINLWGSSSVLVERSAIRIIWVTLILVRLFIE